jgi:hypothetical protein
MLGRRTVRGRGPASRSRAVRHASCGRNAGMGDGGCPDRSSPMAEGPTGSPSRLTAIRLRKSPIPAILAVVEGGIRSEWTVERL